MTEGRKDDTGKLRWSLFPKGTLKLVLEVLEIGAKKYDVDNWKKVPNARVRYYDALMRHIDAWWGGQKDDPEDGKHHLAHAACCLLFLLSLDESQVGRPEVQESRPVAQRGPWQAVRQFEPPDPETLLELDSWDGEVIGPMLCRDVKDWDPNAWRFWRHVNQ